MDERHHGARSARLAAADKGLASMRAAAETVDRDQQRAIIAELIERVTVDTKTREGEIRVLVGDAPATDESRVSGTPGGDGGGRYRTAQRADADRPGPVQKDTVADSLLVVPYAFYPGFTIARAGSGADIADASPRSERGGLQLERPPHVRSAASS